MSASKKGKEKAVQGEGQYADRVSDPRFARLHSDPRFLRPNREDAKVVLDDRFKGLLSGKGDAKSVKIDKYGRRKKEDKRGQEELSRLYRIEKSGPVEDDASSNSSASPVTKAGKTVDYARGEGVLESSGDEESEEESEESDLDEEADGMGDVLIGTSQARRRHELAEISSTGSGSGSDEEGSIDTDDDRLAELDARAERAVKQETRDARRRAKQASVPFAGDTSRLAAVNMDWDHIRAIDLFKVFSSIVSPAARSSSSIHAERRRQAAASGEDRPIVPLQGRCLGVRIYPSEFGRKRMAMEMTDGPPKEIFKSEEDADVVSNGRRKKTNKGRKKAGKDAESDDDDVDDEELYEIDEGGDFDEEALRKYQLDRLRYYYAIATFDGPQTARYVFDSVDGSEMEHTANMFDLSFVPEEMSFPDWQASNAEADDEGFRDEANERTINEASYQGVDFATDALRHSKVKLTWDADDPQRSKLTRQAGQKALTSKEIRDDDFRAYLASASEESEVEQSDDQEADGKTSSERDRVRKLLGLANGSGNGFGKARSAAFADGRKTANAANEGDMQITFLPGLSEAAERRKKGIKAKDEEEETTLDKYKRKQKERRERRKAGGTDDDGAPLTSGEAFTFDDDFFADNDDGEIDFDAALAAERSSSKKKLPIRQTPKAVADVQPETDGRELELLVNSDDDLADSRVGHFSLKDILKAEQAADGKAKKGRWAKKKEKRAGERGRKGDNEVQENFQIDVQDPRFSNLYQDHRFALDPNHPNYIKTKNTQKLVEERRKQTEKVQRTSEQGAEKPPKSTADDTQLTQLVQSVKKRAAQEPAPGKAKKKSRGGA